MSSDIMFRRFFRPGGICLVVQFATYQSRLDLFWPLVTIESVNAAEVVFVTSRPSMARDLG